MLALLFLVSCQAVNKEMNVTILDGKNVIHLKTSTQTTADILTEAGIDRAEVASIQFHGANIPDDSSLPAGGTYTLEFRRRHNITIQTPDGATTLLTGADTVGQVLHDMGLDIYVSDFIAPPADTPISSDLSIHYVPARDVLIQLDGRTIPIKTSKPTVGQALVSAGLPLNGLDTSNPSEMEPIPADGQIKIIRGLETLTLQEKSIPFSKKIEYSIDQPVGEQKVIQAGELGLMVSRIRTIFADGIEVSKITEAETLIRQPKESIIQLSATAPISSINTPQGPIQYWRVVQMYTTSYSPCRSGTPKCSYGTASGIPVKQGVVALIPSLFNQLRGSKVYIPGYGIAVIGDVGGGFPDGRLWIDLGFSDDDYQSWSGFHTVYFLAPSPSSIPAGLN